MTESAGFIRGIYQGRDKAVLEIVLEPVDDTLDALSQVYEWRIGEKVRVIGNERT